MLEVPLALGFVAFALWIWWKWKLTSTFSDLGIPGPKPNLIFGNLLELYIKGPIKCHEEWVAKYGRVFGYYQGMKPVLLVADPGLLKNIFIKDFTKFTDREPFNPLARPEDLDEYSQSVLAIRGQKWKEIRSVLTPSFSAAKMKQMSSMMSDSSDLMMKVLHQRAENELEIDILNAYQRLTMDVIAKTAFGVLLDVQTEKNPHILEVSQLLFRTPYRASIVFIGLVFPWLKKLALRLQDLMLRILNRGASPTWELRKGLQRALQHRKTHPESRKPDILQLMIDSKISLSTAAVDVKTLEVGGDHEDEESNTAKADNESKMVRNMTEKEIVASAFTVFLAGYETTSTALAFTSYLLAKYPDAQERVYQEIKELVEKEGKIEYGTINKLPYLDKVFNESLRIYPPVYLFTNRYAGEDVEYGSLKIPKGMVVQAPVYLLHHDPDIWPDPEVFDPERFNTKPNTEGITFLPFGVGPRNCMGMRFAQMEAKLALAKVIRDFRMTLPESQKGELDIQLRVRTISPRHGVKVKLEKRTNAT